MAERRVWRAHNREQEHQSKERKSFENSKDGSHPKQKLTKSSNKKGDHFFEKLNNAANIGNYVRSTADNKRTSKKHHA